MSLATDRQEARAFTDKQVQLVETFADQAVIAIGTRAAVRGGAIEDAAVTELRAAADGDVRGIERNLDIARQAAAVFASILETQRAFAKRNSARCTSTKMVPFARSPCIDAPPAFAGSDPARRAPGRETVGRVAEPGHRPSPIRRRSRPHPSRATRSSPLASNSAAIALYSS